MQRGGDARYLLMVDSILSVEPGSQVKAGDVLARIPTASAKTGDITGGLPRVAELFEARRPKDHAIIAEVSGTVEFGKDYKNKQRITIKPDDESEESVEYLIPRGKSLAVQHGDRIERGDFVYDGHPAPHDILAIKGVEHLANYLINEIQDVYRLQGVTINDKHIEVIVRQMLQKVEIMDVGDTDLIKGERPRSAGGRGGQSPHREGRASGRRSSSLFCSASPRPRCRRARSSRPPRSRRPRACSPTLPSTARSIRSRA